MRVLVHGQAAYNKGGIESYVYTMAEHISKDICFDYVIEEDQLGPQIKLSGKGDTLYISPKRHIIKNLRSWTKLLFERKGIDDVVYFNWYSMAWLFPAIIARKNGYKVIIHAHNNSFHKCRTIQRVLHMVNRQIQKRMKIMRLTNSNASTKFFFDNKPAYLIYNAIDVERFAYCEEKRKKIRGDINLSDKRVYGFAGRIVWEKNIEFLLAIFNEIKKKDSNAAFLVCGDGDLLRDTKRKAAEYQLNIYFTGSVHNIEDFYQAMDVFVFPSRSEGLGIVLIEVQCAGVPVVASANVIPEIVKISDNFEFLSLKESPTKWAESAIEMANKKINRTDMVEIIRRSRFNIENEVKVFQNYVTNVCKNSSAVG